MSLEELLDSLKAAIDHFQLTEAQEKISIISEDYPEINSINQEAYFLLLTCYYDYRMTNKEKAFERFKTEFLPLLEDLSNEDLPEKMQEVYYYLQATDYYKQGKYNESYQYYLKQLPLIKNKIVKASVNYNIALLLLKLGDIYRAIPYAEKAQEIYKRESENEKSISTANLLGSLFIETNDYQQAERYLLEAYESSDEHHLEGLKAKILHNLALIYKYRGDLGNSLQYLYRSLQIKESLNLNLLITYRSIIESYLEINAIDEAEKKINEAKDLVKEKLDEIHLKVLQAKICFKQNNYKCYESLMSEAIEYLQIHQHWKYLKDSPADLAEYYLQHNKYKLAAKYYKMAYTAEK